MYKLLIITDRDNIRETFEKEINWSAQGYRTPIIVSNAQDGIDVLNSRAVDAVGYHLEKHGVVGLLNFLRNDRPSLPIFEVHGDPEKQRMILDETRMMLDRMHADYADNYAYDEEAMLTIQQDELVHGLLNGRLHDMAALERGLKLIRYNVDPSAVCILYEIDMPQGDVYLSMHSENAQQRLESAMRNNFFRRFADNVYYALSVLTPRRIRLVCMQAAGAEEDLASFADKSDSHVRTAIANIKEYLDLDMNVLSSSWLDGLGELLNTEE